VTIWQQWPVVPSDIHHRFTISATPTTQECC
jgi:hypothetical protein